MSGKTCLSLPFRRCFALVKSRRIVRIESEKSGKCHSKLVHSYRLYTFNHCFPCGYGFNQTKKGEKAVNVSVFTVRHVFVEFVKGMESGIRNPEFATLFLLLFVENHFAFTIFFCISFFKIIEYYTGSLRSLLSLL